MSLIIRCFYSLFFLGAFLHAQEGPKISLLELENQLRNKWVSCITQDAKGFIWIGTQDGLHRYDGYHFEIFRNSPEEPESLAANWVRVITADAKGNFWIGSHGGGLTWFSPKNMTFRNFALESKVESGGKTIFNAVLINKEHLASCTEEGVQIYNIDTHTRRNLDLGHFDSPLATSENLLWLAENQNLYTHDLKSGATHLINTFDSRIDFLKYTPETGLLIGLESKLVIFDKGRIKKEIPMDESIIGFTSDINGNCFLASANSLFRFDRRQFGVQKIHTDLDTDTRDITTIFTDRQGNLWVGTDKGLYKEEKINRTFLQDSMGLHARRIVTHKGSIYLGGKDGLFRMNGKKIDTLMEGKEITALFDEGESLVAGGVEEEIYKFANDGRYTSIPLPNTINKKMVVYGLAKDNQDRLWVGSWQGLHIIDKQGRLVKSIPLETESNNDESKITDIHIDSKDRLWIITSAYGLYMIEGISNRAPEQINFRMVNYRNAKGDPNSITSNIILTLEEDKKGQMWFGTDIGVVKYLEKTRNFERLEYQQKLFDKKVMALRADGDDNLWITSINEGIYVYNGASNVIRHFTTKDGLISNAFLFGSGFYDETGNLLLFGTDEGVQKLDLSHPFSYQQNPTAVITSINVPTKSGETVVFPSQAPYLQEISLAPDQNDFSIKFSAMDFTTPEKISYAYSLDNGEWRMTDLQTAYFTNIPHGDHVLKVKALNDGRMDNNNVTELGIYVRHPWYYGPIAKTVYSLLFLTLILGIYRYLRWRWKMQLDLKFNEDEAKRFKELNDFKSRLYTDIAHEFKTPLTLISGPIDSALSQGSLSDFHTANFSIVQRNADRLTALVDQLLELAKLEDGKLSLNISKGDLGLFLQMISRSFQFHAQLKEIEYNVDVASIGLVWYDEDIIEKIMNNLLTNAIKYTKEDGHCSFTANKRGNWLNISIKNTARNADQLQLDKLFTRFYQCDKSSEGAGVGLSLVRELVKAYGGSITASLESGDLLHFQLVLPIDKIAFPKNAMGEFIDSSTKTLEEVKPEKINGNHKCQPLLLIVEDHMEIRSFIRLALQKEYKILEAGDGKKGMEIALDQVPDIILSDITMPLGNGIELCDILKNDERTSHIPIILLTASVGEKHELKGLTSGADDYITKPFKITVLKQRIANLIAIRNNLQKRYSKELILKPKDIAISPGDEVFLNKVQGILDEHLSDPEFNSETFSKLANMSRMQLHRKLLAYTGLSTSAFIRSQRLNLAVGLLNSSDLTVSEVAYSVGFNTPRYFMKCFKQTFKKTPTEYLQ